MGMVPSNKLCSKQLFQVMDLTADYAAVLNFNANIQPKFQSSPYVRDYMQELRRQIFVRQLRVFAV